MNKKYYFKQTDCFLLCFGIDNKTSFTNIQTKWIPELKHYAQNTPIVLVGTKLDSRIEGADKFVTKQVGEDLKVKIGAKSYVECNAVTGENLLKVFEEAVRACRRKPSRSNWKVFLNAL